jgi:hypothetical protein
LEGSELDLIEVLSWNLAGSAEEKQEHAGMPGAHNENGTNNLANMTLDHWRYTNSLDSFFFFKQFVDPKCFCENFH